MKIIIGLGNPGFRYRNTRHNVGFLLIKALSKKYKISIKNRGFSGLYGVGRINQEEVMLFQPLTYMNLSGQAVKAVVSSKLKEKENLIVVSDDLNLPLGSIRLREKGSAGGHNGLKSIIDKIGQDFTRLRIGISSGMVPEDTSTYVLASFPRKERKELENSLIRAVECIEMWIDEGTKKSMNLYN